MYIYKDLKKNHLEAQILLDNLMPKTNKLYTKLNTSTLYIGTNY